MKCYSFIISEKKGINFSRISGDYNKIHLDELTGYNSMFGEKICHGCLVILKTFKILDIILFIPITRAVSDITYDNDRFEKDKKKGLVDEEFRGEVDSVFKALKYDWDVNMASNIFDPRDKPALIEVFGSPRERIELAKLYINLAGDSIDGDMNNIITEAELAQSEEFKRQLGVDDGITQEVIQNTRQ